MKPTDDKNKKKSKTKLMEKMANLDSPAEAQAFTNEFLKAYPEMLAHVGNAESVPSMLQFLRNQIDVAIKGSAMVAVAIGEAGGNAPPEFLTEAKARESALVVALIYAALRGTFHGQTISACEQLHRGVLAIFKEAKKAGVPVTELRFSSQPHEIPGFGMAMGISVQYGDPNNPKTLKPSPDSSPIPDDEDDEPESAPGEQRSDGLGVDHDDKPPTILPKTDDPFGGRIKPPSTPDAN